MVIGRKHIIYWVDMKNNTFKQKYLRIFFISSIPFLLFGICHIIVYQYRCYKDYAFWIMGASALLALVVNIYMSIKEEKDVKKRILLIFTMPMIYLFVAVVAIFIFLLSLDWTKFHM